MKLAPLSFEESTGKPGKVLSSCDLRLVVQNTFLKAEADCEECQLEDETPAQRIQRAKTSPADFVGVALGEDDAELSTEDESDMLKHSSAPAILGDSSECNSVPSKKAENALPLLPAGTSMLPFLACMSGERWPESLIDQLSSKGDAPGATIQMRVSMVPRPFGNATTSTISDLDDSSSKHSRETRTSLMLRNIPNDYSRDGFMSLLDSEGFRGRYDFLYLPIDFQRKASLGYCFVNCVAPEDAQRLIEHFDGFDRWSVGSRKVCEVKWGEPLQGLQPHLERFRNHSVMHHAVPDEFKPVWLRHGMRTPFPCPTRKLRPPQVQGKK